MSGRRLVARGAAAALLGALAACEVRELPPADSGGAGPGAARSAADTAALRAELLAIGRTDQEVRAGMTPASMQDTAFMRRMMTADSTHTARLREVVRAHGWPTAAMVGAEAAKAAWLVLQHTSDHAFQREGLRLIEASARADVPPSDLAMLTDRVLVREGKPQRYGTQFSLEDGKFVADPIEDLAGLDARRQAVGMPPMAVYVKGLGEAYKATVVWPPE